MKGNKWLTGLALVALGACWAGPGCTSGTSGRTTPGAGPGGAASSGGASGAAGHGAQPTGGTAGSTAAAAGANGSGAAGKPTAPWPGWQRLPGFPCELYRPDDVASSITPLEWEDVVEAPGWRVMKSPWLDLMTPLSVGAAENRVVTSQRWPTWNDQVVYRHDDGAPLAAVRAVGSCVFVRGRYGRTVGLFYRSDEKISYDWGMIWSTEQDLASAEDFSGKYQEESIGSLSANQVSPTGFLWSNMLRLDFATGKVAPIPRPPNVASPQVQFEDVVMVDKATQGLVVTHADGTWDVWPVNVRQIATDGQQIAWLQGDLIPNPAPAGPTYSHCELWASPYGKLADLQPKKVSRIPLCETSPAVGPPVLAAGHFALRFAGGELTVHRLADGVNYVLDGSLPPSVASPPGASVPRRLRNVQSLTAEKGIFGIGFFSAGLVDTAVEIPWSSLAALPPL